jgi:hypothetical protein
MSAFPIQKLIKDMKNVSDETTKAFIGYLLEKGEVTISGKTVSEEDMVQMYKDMSEAPFNAAQKINPKQEKTKEKAPRKVSAWQIFASEKRDEIKTENPDLTFAEISKKLGEMWAKADKSVWQAKADEHINNTAPSQPQSGKGNFATAAAKKYAETNDLIKCIDQITGTGKNNTIKLSDLKTYQKNLPKTEEKIQQVEEEEEQEEVEEEAVEEEEEQEEVEEEAVEEEAVEEEAVEEEAVEEEEEEVEEEEEEEVEEEDEEEDDPESYVGWNCKVWNESLDDWRDGEIIKYNKKKNNHTIRYDTKIKGQPIKEEIDVSQLKSEDHFEWTDN